MAAPRTLPLPNVKQEQLDFLHKVVPAALSSQRALGLPFLLTPITIAQAILESAAKDAHGVYHWGLSRLFRIANNPFGIKWAHRQGVEDYGQFDAATWEIQDGHKIEEIDKFQRFGSLEDGFTGHAGLLMRPRYRPCMDALADPAVPDSRSRIQKFAERLGPKTSPDDREHCGYSTNPLYSAELVKLIEEYRLDDPRALDWYATGKDPGAQERGEGT